MSMMPEDSPAVESFNDLIQNEYRSNHNRMKAEISPVEGATVIHATLIERYCFLYAALRGMESDWTNLDLQRYNQLLQLWLKVSSDLLKQYNQLYENGAPEALFIDKVMVTIAEEVADEEVIRRIRARLAAERKVASEGATTS